PPADPEHCFDRRARVVLTVMDFGALPERLAHVRVEIARRQAAAGWSHPVTIVAVTKGFGLEAVEAALAAGLTDLGENRVQEAVAKIDTPVGRRATWHLIGHLQRNKAKDVPGRFALVHSLDSAALAEELDRRAATDRAPAPAALQGDRGGGKPKGGRAPRPAARPAQPAAGRARRRRGLSRSRRGRAGTHPGGGVGARRARGGPGGAGLRLPGA